MAGSARNGPFLRGEAQNGENQQESEVHDEVGSAAPMQEDQLGDPMLTREEELQPDYWREVVVHPPEFTREEMEENRNFFENIARNVEAPYRAPNFLLEMVVQYEHNRLDDERFNASRNLQLDEEGNVVGRKIKKRYVFNREQDQSLICFVIFCINSGLDMSTIQPYRDLARAAPMFKYLTDPRIIMNRLKHLCHEDNVRELEAYCGYNTAGNENERNAVVNVARTIRASCLDTQKVVQWNLIDYVKAKSRPVAQVHAASRNNQHQNANGHARDNVNNGSRHCTPRGNDNRPTFSGASTTRNDRPPSTSVHRSSSNDTSAAGDRGLENRRSSAPPRAYSIPTARPSNAMYGGNSSAPFTPRRSFQRNVSKK